MNLAASASKLPQLLTAPCITLQNPFARKLVRGDKDLESRNSGILSSYAGSLMFIREGRRPWDEETRPSIWQGPSSGSGRIIGAVVWGPTRKLLNQVALDGDADVTCMRVGMQQLAHVGRHVTEVLQCFEFAAPLIAPKTTSETITPASFTLAQLGSSLFHTLRMAGSEASAAAALEATPIISAGSSVGDLQWSDGASESESSGSVPWSPSSPSLRPSPSLSVQ